MMVDKLDSLSVERCPECHSSLLLRDLEKAEVVCGTCGFVLSTKMQNQGPEWRVFTPEDRDQKVRVGAPQTFMLHDKGLSTKIDWRDINGYAPEKKAQLYRIRLWQQRSQFSGSEEKSLARALSTINRIADTLSLPKNIVETSAVAYRKAVNKGLIRGRSIRSMAVAVTYLACRQNKLMRTVTELSKASGVNRKEITSNYRFLVRSLKLFVPPVKPNRQISKLSTQLELDGVTEGIAHNILVGARRQKLTSGKSAKSLAAAACYIASVIAGASRTQREVAGAAYLTEVTIRNRYKEMMMRLNIVISL